MAFPIYFENGIRGDGEGDEKPFRYIKVDYRCFYVENNWRDLYRSLISISNNNLILVAYKKDGKIEQSFLRDFNNLFNQEIIPEQSL